MTLKELEETVYRYCEMVDVMAGSCVSDYQALYDKAKAEQALYIQLKGSLKARDPVSYVEETASIRNRFKLAHVRMQILEAQLKERGINLQAPDERSPCIRLITPTKQTRTTGCCVIC